MKKICCVAGIILILCGVVLYLIAGAAQEEMEPREVKTGYSYNGEYVWTGKGYIGGNTEGQKDMGFLKGIGIAIGICGATALGVSFVFRDDDQDAYYS